MNFLGMNGTTSSSSAIDTASRLVTQLGFPIVTAGVLLWFLLTRFDARMEAIVDRMTLNAAIADGLAESQAAQLGELERQTKILEDVDGKLGRLLEAAQQASSQPSRRANP